jgi:O-succinylhomoserine sulfhydrylase
MSKQSKNETAAIRTQLAKLSYLEHSNPLYLTSSFVFEDAEDMRASFAEEKNRNVYSRFSNPNNAELVDKLCQLEGAEAGHTFATGMGAIFSSFFSTTQQWRSCLVCSRCVWFNTYLVYQNFPKVEYRNNLF